MRTVRNSSRLLSGGGSPHTLEQTPLGADPPEQAPPPPSRHPPPETCCKACWDTTCNACWDSTPPCCKACWDTTCKACWDTTPCGQTDTCKNITFATSLRTVTTLENNLSCLSFSCGPIFAKVTEKLNDPLEEKN